MKIPTPLMPVHRDCNLILLEKIKVVILKKKRELINVRLWHHMCLLHVHLGLKMWNHPLLSIIPKSHYSEEPLFWILFQKHYPQGPLHQKLFIPKGCDSKMRISIFTAKDLYSKGSLFQNGCKVHNSQYRMRVAIPKRQYGLLFRRVTI